MTDQPIFAGKHGKVYQRGKHFATEGAGHLLCCELAAEVLRLREIIEVMDRKQRHGCADALCSVCDKN